MDDSFSQIENLRKRVFALEREVAELRAFPKLHKRREMQTQINQLAFVVKTLMEGQ